MKFGTVSATRRDRPPRQDLVDEAVRIARERDHQMLRFAVAGQGSDRPRTDARRASR